VRAGNVFVSAVLCNGRSGCGGARLPRSLFALHTICNPAYSTVISCVHASIRHLESALSTFYAYHRQDTLDQRRRSARKVEQLSEWRLQFEKDKMERWDKLQQRLDLINARRAARMQELQRRAADEESKRLLQEAVLSSGATVPVTDASAVHSTSVPSATPGAVTQHSAAAGLASSAVALASAVTAALGGGSADPGTATLSRRVPRSTTPSSFRLSAALRPVSASATATVPSGHSASNTALPAADTRKTTGAARGAPAAATITDENAPQMTSAQDDSKGKALRSKAREKKDKRKLKAQLIELAHEADLAALHEAIAVNMGTIAATAVTVPTADAAAVNKVDGKARSATIAFPAMAPAASTVSSTAVSAAEQYAAARFRLQGCTHSAVVEGYDAWKLASCKKIATTARGDTARHCAACLTATADADVGGTVESYEPALDNSYTAPSAEHYLLQLLDADPMTNPLAQVVRDLFTAARKSRSGECSGSALTLQVMQRLYVVLQHAAVPVPDNADGGDAGSTAPTANVSEILLLRLVLGPEVGVLRDVTELQGLFDALILLHHSRLQEQYSGSVVTPAEVGITPSMELEVRAEVWKLVLEILPRCTANAASVALCVQCGLGTVLVDLLQSLLQVLDTHRKSNASVWPTAVATVASVTLSALFCVLSTTNSTAEAMQAPIDALVWYMFTLGQIPALAYELQSRLQHWQQMQSYHYLAAKQEDGAATGKGTQLTVVEDWAPAADFVRSAAAFIGSVAVFVG
jgi:hypothetical protein